MLCIGIIDSVFNLTLYESCLDTELVVNNAVIGNQVIQVPIPAHKSLQGPLLGVQWYSY